MPYTKSLVLMVKIAFMDLMDTTNTSSLEQTVTENPEAV